jgi:hypothetical protein
VGLFNSIIMKTKTNIMNKFTNKIKTAIIKWLGLDYVVNKLDNVSEDLYNKDWGAEINYRKIERELDYGRFDISSSDVAENFDTYDIARELDYSSIACELDTYDIASNIEASDIAYAIDKDELASCVDWDDLIADSLQRYFEGDRMNEFSHIVAEKIADRDGMQELVSEEVDNQVSGISTDAVQAMIDTAIQQFADSLEVMVSAKLNINK